MGNNDIKLKDSKLQRDIGSEIQGKSAVECPNIYDHFITQILKT